VLTRGEAQIDAVAETVDRLIERVAKMRPGSAEHHLAQRRGHGLGAVASRPAGASRLLVRFDRGHR